MNHAGDRSSSPLRVLFVEDDRPQAEALAKLLRKRIVPASLEMCYAQTIAEGLKRKAELLPCIVFLDLQFPEADWHSTVSAIPQFKSGEGTIVIVITEMDLAEVEIECRAAGATEVFSKQKIPGIVDIIIHVVANIGKNMLACEALKEKNGHT